MELALTRTKWERISVDPRQILLDEENPRMPGITPGQSRDQGALKGHIIRSQKFLGLCESITNFGGMYPFENVILFSQNGSLIALEGNRRICACQILLEPNKHDLEPRTLAAIPRASDSVLKNLENIDAFLVDSREAGAALLAHLHSFPRFARETWHTLNRMNFIHNGLSTGASTKELAELFAVEEKDILELSQNSKILSTFRYSLDWNEEHKIYLFEQPEDRDFESFLHIVNSPAVKKHFGQPFFDEHYHLNKEGHPDISEKLMLIAKHTLLANFLGSSIVHKKHESVEKYLEQVWPLSTDHNADTSDLFSEDFASRPIVTISPINTPDTTFIDSQDTEAKTQDGKSADRRVAPYYHDELFGKFECKREDDDRLMEICRELKRLSNMPDGIRHFSIAFCLLLRALLEWSLIYHLEHSGDHKTKGQNGRYLPLKQIVKYCQNQGQGTFNSGPVLEKLEIIRSKWLDELHLITHSNAGNRSEQRIKDMVGDIKPVLRHILNEANYE